MYCAKFYPKKKKKQQQKKDKSIKKQKVGYWMEKGNSVHHTLPPFLSHFLSILERLNFGGPREKTDGPHHFSLPLPFSTKHPSHLFSLLLSTFFFFFFFYVHPKIHPTKHTIFLLIHDYACRNFIYSLLTRVLICLA